MPLFTVSINNLAPVLDHKASEVALIAQYLGFAAQAVQGAQGNLTSGNILDYRGTGNPIVMGTWTYTPQASLP
jgi:hypothetical protein